MKIHMIGIGGTGMGAVAGLLKAKGHDIRGSDTQLYPPMSDQLTALQIPVFTGFSEANLSWNPDLVVVGNVCRKDHVEVVEAEKKGVRRTSFPALLGDEFLAQKHSLVVTGTHGKTTTSSLLAHIFSEAGKDPSWFVGGVPLGSGSGWHLGKGPDFVVEGDEYDTAFFDKESKFFHYQPKCAILTSVELDHVDIFSSLQTIRAAFTKFVSLIPEDGYLAVAADQPLACEIAHTAKCKVETYVCLSHDTKRADTGTPDESGPSLASDWVSEHVEYLVTGRTRFELSYRGESMGRFETLLTGAYNISNATAAIAIAYFRGIPIDIIRRGVHTFAGVARRQQFRGVASGVTVLDDYAHHPTAVEQTLLGLKKRFRGQRLVALYEPKSNTSRTNTFQQEFVKAFSHADVVVVGPMADVSRIPAEKRFDPEALARDLHRVGTASVHIPQIADIVTYVVEKVRPGDIVVTFSSGAFGGIHDTLLSALGDAVIPARMQDFEPICQLLEKQSLDFQDLKPDDITRSFYVLWDDGVAGCIAIEIFGEDAVLRSLAVQPDRRGQGYGWMLAETAIAQTRRRGIRRLYLLAGKQASDFFAEKLGFRAVDLSTVAKPVKQSPTFAATGSKVVAQIAMRLDL